MHWEPPGSPSLVRKRTTFSLRWAEIPKYSHFSRLISVTAQNTKPECNSYLLYSENPGVVKGGFLERVTSSALLGQTNPATHLWTRGEVSALAVCTGPPLLPGISPSLPLLCSSYLQSPTPASCTLRLSVLSSVRVKGNTLLPWRD